MASLSGCADSYVTPGAKADLQSFAPTTIQSGFEAKPTNPFPASIAAVRVQASTYTNYFLQQNGGLYGSGNGRYSVVMTREVEDQAQFDRIGTLPQVTGVVAINRLLLPAKLESDRELREAAARLHANLVFVYTFDTAFFNSDAATALTVVTLGLSPTRKVTAVTTVSSLLLDTLTGYVYSVCEATGSRRGQFLEVGFPSLVFPDITAHDFEASCVNVPATAPNPHPSSPAP